MELTYFGSEQESQPVNVWMGNGIWLLFCTLLGGSIRAVGAVEVGRAVAFVTGRGAKKTSAHRGLPAQAQGRQVGSALCSLS